MKIDPNLPIDKSAKFVVSKSKHHGADFHPGGKISSMIPLPTTYFKGRKEFDLTGQVKGRLTIIGVFASLKRNPRYGSKWVVRCQCGRYETRVSSTWNRKETNDMCHQCHKINGS